MNVNLSIYDADSNHAVFELKSRMYPRFGLNSIQNLNNLILHTVIWAIWLEYRAEFEVCRRQNNVGAMPRFEDVASAMAMNEDRLMARTNSGGWSHLDHICRFMLRIVKDFFGSADCPEMLQGITTPEKRWLSWLLFRHLRHMELPSQFPYRQPDGPRTQRRASRPQVRLLFDLPPHTYKHITSLTKKIF